MPIMTQEHTNAVAVIVAGGQGLRMQNAIPKQFLPLNGKPVLYYAINAFVEAIPGIRIVLVLPQSHFSYANSVLQHFSSGIDITIVAGGSNRFESVKNGLSGTAEADIIFVHDGVRPLLSTALIQNCYAAATEFGSAIPVVPVTDSIRQLDEQASRMVDRESLRAVQTPQTDNRPTPGRSEAEAAEVFFWSIPSAYSSRLLISMGDSNPTAIANTGRKQTETVAA